MISVIAAGDVPGLIPDGATVMLTGITLGGFAEEAMVELEKSFLATGAPRDLTFYFQSGVGNRKDRGLAYVAREGLMKRAVGGHIMGCGPALVELCRDDRAEVYNLPQGVMATMCRYIAARKPGVITKVGLGTMVDPRLGGGKMNSRTRDCEDLVEVVTLLGEEWLLYRLPRLDVALIRGTEADERGNVTLSHEGYQLGQLAAAQAARACGGIVICQVERIVKSGTLHPKAVRVPGILIDHVYVARPEYHWQTAQTPYNPVFSGEARVPLDAMPVEKLSMRKVIARRATMELAPGMVVNLGVGIPEAVSSVAAEEGVGDAFTLTTEAGAVGGLPAGGHDFGCAWNPEATLEMADQFDFYDSGGLDLAVLGCLQVAPNGDVNASMRDGGGIGVGGFINVAQGAKRIVFAMTFTGGLDAGDGAKVRIGDGRLEVGEEGNRKKFVRSIEQITFNAEQALRNGQEVRYVTERAVFRLSARGLVLTELAPGVDLELDVLAQMEFAPIVADRLGVMPPEIFQETWDGLGPIVAAAQAK
ncbi:acyl CoA:acetate/3-ketoacid CoA transferase [Cellulomonas sp. KRMCY2]|uniref:acyl CoA:acetate/3-ketoacid CoA transferase n=1 Tax=Cellulomonas sp. KRMCY2 TaxID=1304865 RepID=UPI00045E8835|nr:CoA-transferase [Cellulomonas sp. KRMCY2]